MYIYIYLYMQVDVELEDVTAAKKQVMGAIFPRATQMDFNIGAALWLCMPLHHMSVIYTAGHTDGLQYRRRPLVGRACRMSACTVCPYVCLCIICLSYVYVYMYTYIHVYIHIHRYWPRPSHVSCLRVAGNLYTPCVCMHATSLP